MVSAPVGSRAASAPELAPPHDAGTGRIAWRRSGSRTVATSVYAASPLKLLLPRQASAPSAASWAFACSYGGGLLAGDAITLALEAGPGTTAFFGTQASTKIYRSPLGLSARQTLSAKLSADAVCVVAPDPVTCFAGAVYEQTQTIELEDNSAGLVWLDWLTSGRPAFGERWAFDRYRSRTEIFVGGRRIMLDSLLLDPADGPLRSPSRLGAVNCLAVLVIMGHRFCSVADSLLNWVESQPLRADPALLFSASPLGGSGLVLRVAGEHLHQVGHWLRERLSFVPPLLGGDPWLRKF